MLTKEQKNQFNDILEELGKSLDISKTQYDAAVKSYQAVGEQLSKEDSNLAPYSPEIIPQGSFLFGTMTKPIHEDDDLDIDLVCQLTGKRADWTQLNLKQEVGDQLKKNKLYEERLDKPDGRRCWTLRYRDNSTNSRDKYHMDILPAIVDKGYKIVLEKAFSKAELDNKEDVAIRITDKIRGDYQTERDHKVWLLCNPFGYGKWFFQQAILDHILGESFRKSIQPVPAYSEEKLPLQRTVQILKRHRDMMFNGDEHKPISIIITTLAARAYNKETNIIEALLNVVDRMANFIEERYSVEHGRVIKWIGNPVNQKENFADKWPETPEKQDNFYKWLEQVQLDLNRIKESRGELIMKSMSDPFGKGLIEETFHRYGEKHQALREAGNLKMAKGTGILGAAGVTVRNHNFHGND